jgi:hypothetical protein
MNILPINNPLIYKRQLKCSQCIYSKVIKNDVGENVSVCRLFKYSFTNKDNYIDVLTCRNDSNLCGHYAEYFKSKPLQ